MLSERRIEFPTTGGDGAREAKAAPMQKKVGVIHWDWHGRAPVPLLIATIVSLVVYVAFIAWFSLREPPRVKGPAEIRFNAYADGLAKKCQGDLSKLKPAERKKLDSLTMGHGARMILEYYKNPQ